MSDIYQYVLTEKNNYEAGVGVPVTGNWNWKMFDHCNYTLLMKNGQFPLTQTKMGDRPMKNIMLPILNVAYRTEGFDVKDIELYVEDQDYFHMSLLARKYHTKWARKYSIDTFIDDVVEGLDYGFVLVKNVNDKRPEVVQPQQIAFCDQTDILSGPICLKHSYSVDQLLDTVQKNGWDADAVDKAIKSASNEKENLQTPGQVSKTPSKYVEVYEIHGTFCDDWLTKSDDVDYNESLDSNSYSKQIHIITYVKDDKGDKYGITLFKGRETKTIFKLLVINAIFGRAAGRGRVETLFEPQIWTNFNMIHMTNMLKEASKVIQVTDDPKFTQRNNTKNLVGGEFLVVDEGRKVSQLNTNPVNINLFDRANQEWEQFARVTGSASDPALGLSPTSGTPLGTTQIVTNQGEGIHEYIRGKVATFISEIYRDWVLDYLVTEMNKGDKWVDELDSDELQEVAEKIATNASNNRIKELVLNGKIVTPQQQSQMRDLIKQEFLKGGKKRFMEIIEGEFKDLPMNIYVNVANKQKDLGKLTDKLSNVFRTIFANPQGFIATMQIPAAAKAFSEMLEASGLSPMDFSGIPTQSAIPSPMQQGQLNQPVPVAKQSGTQDLQPNQ